MTTSIVSGLEPVSVGYSLRSGCNDTGEGLEPESVGAGLALGSIRMCLEPVSTEVG